MYSFDLSVLRESKTLPTAELVRLSEKYVVYSIANFIGGLLFTALGFIPFLIAIALSFGALFFARLNLKAKTAEVQQNLVSTTSKDVFKHMDTKTYNDLISKQVRYVSISYGLTVAVQIAIIFIVFICLIATLQSVVGLSISYLWLWVFVPWALLIHEIVESADTANKETFSITTGAALDKLYEINPLRTP